MIDKYFKTERTDIRVHDNSTFADYNLIEEGEGILPQGSFGLLNKYILSLKVATQFNANDVQLPRATEDAKVRLKFELYKDVISDLYDIKSHISDEMLLDKINKLVEKLLGK